MKKIREIIANIFAFLAIVSFSVMLVSTTVQVVGRYIFHNSPMWTEELARYMFVTASMCASVVAMDRGAHMVVDIITAKLKGWTKKIVRLLSQIIVLITCAFIIYLGFLLSIKTMGQPSPSLHLPIGLVYGMIPLGCIGMFLIELEELIETIRKTPEELMEEEKSEVDEIIVKANEENTSVKEG